MIAAITCGELKDFISSALSSEVLSLASRDRAREDCCSAFTPCSSGGHRVKSQWWEEGQITVVDTGLNHSGGKRVKSQWWTQG